MITFLLILIAVALIFGPQAAKGVVGLTILGIILLGILGIGYWLFGTPEGHGALMAIIAFIVIVGALAVFNNWTQTNKTGKAVGNALIVGFQIVAGIIVLVLLATIFFPKAVISILQKQPQVSEASNLIPADQATNEKHGYYSVIDSKKVKEGFYYSEVSPHNTLKECKENLNKSTNGIRGQKCIPDDGRYDAIFKQRSGMGKWYVLVGLTGSPYATIFEGDLWEDITGKVNQSWGEIEKSLRSTFEKQPLSVTVSFVSPKGEIKKEIKIGQDFRPDSFELAKTESQKWAGEPSQGARDGFSYAVLVWERAYNAGEPLGIIQTGIYKSSTKEKCEKFLRNETVGSVGESKNGGKLVTKICVEGDDRFRGLSEKKPIKQWYIRQDTWENLSNKTPDATTFQIYAFLGNWNATQDKDETPIEKFMKSTVQQDRKETANLNVEIALFSPQGEVDITTGELKQ